MQKNNKNIIAHRGFSNIAPENTFLSFEAAYLFGFDGVELDVHLTKDKEIVIIHDETIDRTSNGKGFVDSVYSSFNIESLKILNKINKDLELGFLFDDFNIIKKEENIVKEICKYIHPKYTSLLKKEEFDFYNNFGLYINTWTLDYSKNKEDSLKEFQKLLNIENLVSIICNTKF